MNDLFHLLASPTTTPWCPEGCETIVELHFWDYPTVTVIWASPSDDERTPVYAERIAETAVGQLWVYTRVTDNERDALSKGLHRYKDEGVYPIEELPRLLNGRPIVVAFHSHDASSSLGSVLADGRLISTITMSPPVVLRRYLTGLDRALSDDPMTPPETDLQATIAEFDEKLLELWNNAPEADIVRAPQVKAEAGAGKAMLREFLGTGIPGMLESMERLDA